MGETVLAAGVEKKSGAFLPQRTVLHLVVAAVMIGLGFLAHVSHEFFHGTWLTDLPFMTDEYHSVHWVLTLLPPAYSAYFLGWRGGVASSVTVGALVMADSLWFHPSFVSFVIAASIFGVGFIISLLASLREREHRSLALAHAVLRDHAAAVERQAGQLAALGSMAAAVGQSLDIATISGRALEVAMPALGANQAMLHLHHAEREALILSAYRGWAPEQARQANLLSAREGPLARVAARGETVQAKDFTGDNSPLGRLLQEAGVVCFAAVPIVEENQVLGAISFASSRAEGCSEESLSLMRTMGHQMGAAIANARRYEEVERQRTQAQALARVLQEEGGKLEQVQKEGLESLKRALDTAYPWAAAHSRRVCLLALATAQELGLPETGRELLAQAAEFHHIGLLGVSTDVMKAEGVGSGLGSASQTVRRQIIAGVALLRPLAFPDEALAAVRAFQERWDGSGQPDSLAGEQIPPLARLLAVANEYDWMRHAAIGQPTFSPQEARARIQAGAGILWEPRMVEAMLQALDKDPSLDILSGGDSPGASRPA